ncbi:MAG: aminopeptidase P N-terminal domain-containing protein [Burkholderiaceae bacterium]
MKNVNPVYAERRRRLAQTMTLAGGGVAILSSGQEVMRNRDSDYPFRWDSYFYYLTGFPEPDATVVIVAGDTEPRSLLFCREKDPERETWDGFRYGPEAAAEIFSFDGAGTNAELDKAVTAELANQAAVYYPLGNDRSIDERVRQWLGDVRAQARTGTTAPAQAFDVHRLIDEMRLIKDDHELGLMRRAAEISANAHVRAMKICQPGLHEYEIEAELLHEFRSNGSQFPAYGSIVASGANACVLHYRANDAAMREDDLLLIDAGCELNGYASDITRTFPVNGKFTKGQRELYEIVLAAQQASIDVTRPGSDFNTPHEAAVKVLVQGMLDTGLLSGSLDEALESGSYRRFYMHRTGHWLGMDVHDCGDYRERGGPHNRSDNSDEGPPWRQLQPGMVLTVEPGIYVRAAQDVPERFHDVGIRIEDDAVITDQGCEIITSSVPKDADQIERLMKSR